MNPLCTASEMRALDGHAIDEIGVPSTVLMETAGRGAAYRIRELCDGDVRNDSVTILIGGGNNGGDGMVVARVLAGWGAKVKAIVLAPTERLSPDAELNFRIMERLAVEVIVADSDAAFETLSDDLQTPRVLVDALFGTGLSRALSGRYERACELAGQSSALKISLDVPSGVNATTGELMGCCFPADHCITFGAMKWGHLLPPGRDICQPVTMVDIGIPPESITAIAPEAWIPEREDVRNALPQRHLDSHKGSFGHVLVVAGSAGKAGAAILAGQAALRAGSGLATIASDLPTCELIHAGSPELMTINGRLGTGEEAPLDVVEILKSAQGAAAMVVGPGLGKGPELAQSLATLLEKCSLPTVVDADAIRLLATQTEILRDRSASTILTPHAGEMGALLELSSAEVQSKRRDAVRHAADLCAATVVLKGAGTLTATTDKRIFFNPTGGPWLATAGSGDVLAGCIAGLISQGARAETAAWLAVYVHGLAGDRLSESMGRSGLIATDLVAELPSTLESLRSSQ